MKNLVCSYNKPSPSSTPLFCNTVVLEYHDQPCPYKRLHSYSYLHVKGFKNGLALKIMFDKSVNHSQMVNETVKERSLHACHGLK